MGTRNLTIVRAKKKTRVAQYGQWDGYPTGQGQTIADFLKRVDLKKFKKQVEALGTYTEEDIRKAYTDAGANPDDQFVSIDIANAVDREHPALDRDHGAGILQLIHDGVVTRVKLNEDFKNDHLFCEFWYEIDLDNETVSMNGGNTYTFAQWKRKGLMEKLEEAESED